VSITRDNGVPLGNVWFLLTDFSLILATVVTSLAGFLRPGAGEKEISETSESELEER